MPELLLYVSLFAIWAITLYHLFLMLGGYLFSFEYRTKGILPYNHESPWPTVSILVPAHNEEMVLEETLKSLINQTYPKDRLEIIVINDSSGDSTGEMAETFAKKYHFVKVIHNTPPLGGRGKSAALNRGLGQSSGEIIIVYDADNRPEPNAVQLLALALQRDGKAGALVGKFRVINARRNLLTRLINIETITFQWLAQTGRWHWFKLTTIPGTNFAIRRSILEKLEGWDERALSEDTELSIRVYNMGYHIRFFPSAVTWEQEPETWKVWWRQRTRWVRGNLYVIGKYLFGFKGLSNKKVLVDLLYFLFSYQLFVSGIFISHCILVTGIFVDLKIPLGPVSYVLQVTGFLLFLTEVLLAISMERDQLTLKNSIVVLLMFFVYSQAWLVLVVNAFFLEIKRLILHEEIAWYKTRRFKTEPLNKEYST